MIPFLVFFILLAFGGTLFFILRERRTRRTLERRLQDFDGRLQSAFEHLEEERARLETTFSGMSEGVLLTDQRGDILHLNPAFRAMFQLKGKVEGRSALEILASMASDDAIREVIQKGEAVEREIAFENPRPRVFQVHFSPMRRDGKLFGVVSVFHDLTEIRRLEEVRRDFIANLSHELKTPLTAIRGFSETLLEEMGSDPSVALKHAEIIFRHANELSRLTENLLNLSRIESGKEEINAESIPLKPFVERLVEGFSVQARVKKIELINEIEAAGPAAPTLQADPHKLNQILSNLVDNAIKYTPEGGKVWIRGGGEGGVCIEVEDTGPGIPKEDQDRIFERFYRVDKARSRQSGGAGLGLAIAKHLIELHGGRITIESSFGNGAKFKLTLPQGR